MKVWTRICLVLGDFFCDMRVICKYLFYSGKYKIILCRVVHKREYMLSVSAFKIHPITFKKYFVLKVTLNFSVLVIDLFTTCIPC